MSGAPDAGGYVPGPPHGSTDASTQGGWSDAGTQGGWSDAGQVGTPVGAGGPGSDDGGAPPGVHVCSAVPSDDACTACLRSSCCSAFAGCVGDRACVGLIQCDEACASGDSACGTQCANQYASGQAAAVALVGCEQDACASACGSASTPPAPSPGSGACLPDSTVPAGATDCAGVPATPVERDCPFGSPDAACVPAPSGAANVFCCPARAGASDAGSPVPTSGGPGAAYVDPQAVGLWENSNTSGVDFTNGSGSFASPSGNKAIFQFTADGQYAFEVFMQSSLYSCTMVLFGRETGTVNFHGAGFTLAPVTATITSQDSCNVGNNYKKPWQNRLEGPFEYTWTVTPDPNGSGRRVLTVNYLGDGSSETLLEQPAP